MSKVAVVYWSGTGNTETMANAVAEGAKGAGAEVDVLVANDFIQERLLNIWNRIRMPGNGSRESRGIRV
mgnify:CR=1 FL=1